MKMTKVLTSKKVENYSHTKTTHSSSPRMDRRRFGVALRVDITAVLVAYLVPKTDEGELVEVLQELGDHNHSPDAASIETVAIGNEVKALAAASDDSASAIVAHRLQA